jgi:DNA-binding CsgD family transcriptional regulator
MQEADRRDYGLFIRVIHEKVSSSLLAFGYDYFCLFQLHNDGSCPGTIDALIGNWSAERYAYYMDRCVFQKDPFVREPASRSKTFVTHEDLNHRPLEAAFAAFCENFDINRGFSYHIQNDARRYILCGHASSPASDQPLTEDTAKIIAMYCWSGMAMISFNPDGAKAAPRSKLLTRRQKDCLHWAALGKSDWEIGKVLGLSRHTVHRHIEAAKHRLEVTTRIQAVLALDLNNVYG